MRSRRTQRAGVIGVTIVSSSSTASALDSTISCVARCVHSSPM